MKEAEAITKAIFAKPINLNTNETINTDYDKLPFVKNKAELQNRWKQVIISLHFLLTSLNKKEEATKKEKDAKYQPKSDEVLKKESVESTQKTLADMFSMYNDITREEWFAMFVNAITETF